MKQLLRPHTGQAQLAAMERLPSRKQAPDPRPQRGWQGVWAPQLAASLRQLLVSANCPLQPDSLVWPADMCTPKTCSL